MEDSTDEINPHGNRVERRFFENRQRYFYDFRACSAGKGWRQFDTKEDARYFGVWVNPDTRETLTFAEGDEIRVRCPTEAGFQAELAAMRSFYGPPPPAATLIDPEAGTVTYVYDLDQMNTPPKLRL